jgi:hypothetical protein
MSRKARAECARWARVALLVLLLPGASCRSVPSVPKGEVTAHRAPGAARRFSFRDVTPGSGLHFIPAGERAGAPRTGPPRTILETAGHGCAFLDVDGDGQLEILLVGQPRCALYRRREGRAPGTPEWEEITAAAGLDRPGYWMGCATGDFDNDGRVDLLLTGYRCAALLRNEGGRFRDVSAAIPLDRDAWSTSAVFFDADGDGWLDLYVGAYVRFDRTTLQLCDYSGVRAACPPTYYDPERGRLYRNRGNGTFADATRASGLKATHGKTLGVAAADADGDGRPDLYLANDGVPGDLYRHRSGRFQNIGVESGTAFNYESREQAGMGVDWGDYDGDGRLDLVVTTFQHEPTSLYRNEGRAAFREEAFPAGIGDATLNRLGFGVRFFDADNDGDLDLIQANGHVQDTVAQILPGVTFAQPTLLFENVGSGQFRDVSAAAGAALSRPIVGRGLAVGDYDNDGRLDVLIADLDGPPLLLRNETPPSGHHLTLRLVGSVRPRTPNTGRAIGAAVGRASPRDATGARITLHAGGRTQVREAGTGGSYLSASDPRVHFGVGPATAVDSVTIRWPSGRVQALRNVRTGQEMTVEERDGR